MQYYEDNDRRGRLWGILFLVLYVGVCVGVMFITYLVETPEPEMGVLIDFGTGDTGVGEEDTALSEQDAAPAVPMDQSTSEEPVMTSDDPDAPEIATETQPTAQTAPPAAETAPAREVNRRALFPGRTEGSESTSQGAAEGAGNQGSANGAPNGSNSEGGSGVDGISLAGRYAIVPLPKPRHPGENLSGRVVIRIVVDASGKVTSAAFERMGSTTENSSLVAAALTAARRSRFTAAEAEVQSGTITYIFRLN